jgi:RNA polymerase sigma-70 factor (ECF subfamily)
LSDDEDSDEALVARAGRGDRSAASVLVARHSQKVLALCGRILFDRASAEDAAQETFLKLWENAVRWKPQGAKLETWLYRIATNACLDRLRRRKREAPEEEGADYVDGSPTAIEQLEEDQRRRVVEDALASLPERQRIAMTLCHYQELSNIETAATMEISVEAVESLLARARRSLKAALIGQRDELMEGVR